MKKSLNNISIGAYTKIYQTAGDNIRASGKANLNEFDATQIFSFAKTIEKVIISAKFISKKIIPHAILQLMQLEILMRQYF